MNTTSALLILKSILALAEEIRIMLENASREQRDLTESELATLKRFNDDLEDRLLDA